MTTAKDIMTTDVITIAPETEIAQAAQLLLTNRINGVPVVNEAGELVGILSLFTLLDGFIALTPSKKIEKEVEKIAATTVEDAMTANPVTVNPDTGIEEVAAFMVEKNYHTLPVVDAGKLVGIVGKEDVLRTLIDQ
jgi:CBS domain-containing protein